MSPRQLREGERVVLHVPVPDKELYAGMIGTVVCVYPKGGCAEVEFRVGNVIEMVLVPQSHVAVIAAEAGA